MLRVALLGYYGFNNFGDEAVLFSIIKLLRQEIDDIKFTVLSHDPPQTAASYEVETANRWSLKEIYGALKKSDSLILGGGSLLQDVTGKKSLAYYLGVVKLALLLKKPVIFYAQGLGPLQSSLSRFLVARISQKAALISVRDEASAELFKEIGVLNKKIYLTADPVFGLEPSRFKSSSSAKWEKANRTPTRPMLAFSLRAWGKKDDYIQDMANVADDLAHQGWDIVFCPFHYPADFIFAEKIAQLMKSSPLIFKQPLSLEEMISVVADFQLMVGMRFHALALAGLNRVPFLGISYDPKVEALCSLLGQPLLGRVEDVRHGDLNDAIANALKEEKNLKENLEQNLPRLQAKAKFNALLVKQLLFS